MFSIHKNLTFNFCSGIQGPWKSSPAFLQQEERWKNWKNQQIFLDPAEDWVHRANHCPQTCRDDRWLEKIQITKAEAQEQTTPEPVPGYENLNCSWLLEAQCGQIRELKIPGETHLRGTFTHWWVLPPEARPDSRSEDQRKTPWDFQQEEGKSSHFVICPEHFLLHSACPQEKLFTRA